MPLPKSGRQIMLDRLYEAVRSATTADIQRAAMLLEGAKKIRAGSSRQRSSARSAQANAWEKKVDNSVTW